ncbi:MAG: hypothetical protein V4495_06845 [Pseudomonadota bacterium]
MAITANMHAHSNDNILSLLKFTSPEVMPSQFMGKNLAGTGGVPALHCQVWLDGLSSKITCVPDNDPNSACLAISTCNI